MPDDGYRFLGLWDKSVRSLSSGLAMMNEKEDTLTWSRFPQNKTQFTDHVVKIATNYNMHGNREHCGEWFDLKVDKPYTVPRVECFNSHPTPTAPGSNSVWCKPLQGFFAGKVLPYSVSIGMDTHDFFLPGSAYFNNTCIGTSSPDGILTMPNFEEAIRMFNLQGRFTKPPEKWPGRDDIPFEERENITVFRGSGWIDRTLLHSHCGMRNSPYNTLLRDFPARYKAVDFSVDHPGLLNARFARNLVGPCWDRNATNGLSKLLPTDSISVENYFSNYQSALVLAGIGAAFRLNRHLMTKTAVLLQEYEYVEWYTPYLTPWVHYIPLAQDLSDLVDRLVWMKKHPGKVKEIGENGHQFYTEHLTFQHHREHFYELLYRLSEYNHSLHMTDISSSNSISK